MLRTSPLIAVTWLSACAHAEAPAKSQPTPTLKTDAGKQSDGLVRMASAYSVDETVSRLEAALASREIKVMAKVDHAANADGAGLSLAPTTLVLFGNPAAGTQLMQAARSAGIDLPMKALVYEDDGVVLLEFNAISYIARRHGIASDLPVLAKMEGLLGAVGAEATGTE